MDVKINSSDLYGQAQVFDNVNKQVAADDGMLQGSPEVYFKIGASALSVILEALESIQRPPSSIKSVLDYACGYGRVLRWLQAKFPSARLLGVDANARAAASAAAVLGVDTRPLDISLKEELGETFDLIWVGSLFTHLARSEFGHVLSYLVLHLANEGCLVFTTHGDEVAQRIASRVRVYNLQEAAVETLLAEYTSEGHGFGAYKGMADYGISCTKASAAMQLIERAGLLPVFYKERGWNKHQDVFAAKKQ